MSSIVYFCLARFTETSYHDSLKRESSTASRPYRHQSEKRREFSATERQKHSNESEDEGFASSLLISSEKQPHLDEHHRTKYEYAPRERSIDDGSHYDPRIDRIESDIAKKGARKPPKPEKKSSLEKVYIKNNLNC